MDNNQEDDICILNEINKIAKIGMDSISFVSQKVSDEKMKEELASQYSQYGTIAQKISQAYEKYGQIPDENDIKNKVMGWTGVQLNTLSDKSNSHISQMLIQGAIMGIISCKKLENKYPSMKEGLSNLINELFKFQQENINKLYDYL